MKSAYSVLGIPGNADAEAIEEAFLKGAKLYSHERLADDPSLIDKLTELREAHKLLTNAELRAAHDRKLSAALSQPPVRPRVVIEAQEIPWFNKPLNLMALALVFMVAVGGFMSYSRQQARKEQAAREIAQQKLEAQAALEAQRKQEQADAERARQMAENERRERQLRAEGSAVAGIAAYVDVQRQAAANRQIETDRREAQRRTQETRNEERQRVYEAERRVAADRQRIRDLCYQNYRRYDC